MPEKTKHICFVDDEPNIRTVIKRILNDRGYHTTCFANAEDCLVALHSRKFACLITDVNMPGTTGIELLKKTKEILPGLPVLIITGYGDIRLAVKCMKIGAADFIEKPLDRDIFLAVVDSICKKQNQISPDVAGKLSKTEEKVLELVLTGKSTKTIALLLHRSERTIDDHRYHIMKKLGVHNVIDLVKITWTDQTK